jgi:hypothetical protein
MRGKQCHSLSIAAHRSNQLQVLDVSLSGVTKRAIARINRMEAANLQSRNILQVVCGFMSAGNPIDIVASFRNSRIGLVVDQGGLRCQTCPDPARCLLESLKLCLNVDIPDEDSETDIESNLYMEERVDLMIGPDESQPESRTQFESFDAYR